MIGAAADALIPTQEFDKLDLIHKELNVIKDNFLNIATQAALIAGFAFTGITELDLPDHTPQSFRIAFYLAITAVLACELHVIVIATTCVTGGPNVAMRGVDKAHALVRAVKGMKRGQFQLYITFGVGLWFFELASVLICFAKVWYGLQDVVEAEKVAHENCHEMKDIPPSHHHWGFAVIAILLLQMLLSFSTFLILKNRYFQLDPSHADSWRFTDVCCCGKGAGGAARPSRATSGSIQSGGGGGGGVPPRASYGAIRRASGGGGAGGGDGEGGVSAGSLQPTFQCPKCNVDVAMDQKFCNECGNNLQ